MPRIFCIANQKGGVGKTTTAITLADGIAKAGAKTLLIDLDPQCNASSGLLFAPAQTHPLVSRTPIGQSTVKTRTPGLELLPGSRMFSDVEVLTKANANRVEQMKEQFIRETSGYDFVIIDSPPSLGQLTQVALACSTEVIMPTQCEFFALEGLKQMFDVVKKIMREKPQRLQFASIVQTMYDYSLELTHVVDEDIRHHFGEIVFKTVIPRDVEIVYAASYGESVLDYAPRSRGARAYIELCMELLDHA